MEECYVTDKHNGSQLDFSTYWTECTIEQAIRRGHELRREKPIPLPPREFHVVNIDLVKTPRCRGRRKKPRNSKMRRRRSISPNCCCDTAKKIRKQMNPVKYRVHCGMRIAELAVPTKRHCLETWRTKCHTLPDYMIDRLRKIVNDQKPVVHITDALYCFKRICKRRKKPQKYEEKCDQHLKRKEKVKCLLSLLSGSDTAVLCALFGHKIAKKLAVPMNIVLSPELQNIANVIWCDIACMLRPPTTKGIYTKKYRWFEEDIVKKITIWIAQIMEDLQEKMLEDEVREFEEDVGPALDALDNIVNNAIDEVLPEEQDIFEEPHTDTEEEGVKSSSSSCGSSQMIEVTVDHITIDGGIVLAENPDIRIIDDNLSEEKETPEEVDEEVTAEQMKEEDADLANNSDAVEPETDNTIDSSPGNVNLDNGENVTDQNKDDDVDMDVLPEENDEETQPDTSTGYRDEETDDGTNIALVPTENEDDVKDLPPIENQNDVKDLPPIENQDDIKDLPPIENQDDIIDLPPIENQDDIKDIPSIESQENVNDLPPSVSHEDEKTLIPSQDQDNDKEPPSEPQKDTIMVPLPDGVTQTDEPLQTPTETKETGTDLPPKENTETENTQTKINDEKDEEYAESEDAQQPHEPPDISEITDNDPEVFTDATENNVDESDSDKKVKFDEDVSVQTTNKKTSQSNLLVNWKTSIEHLNFAAPNVNLLSNADEYWPGELLTPVLRPSQSVSKSITSLGQIKEDVEPPETTEDPIETKNEDGVTHKEIDDGQQEIETTPDENKISANEKETPKDKFDKHDTSKSRKSTDSTVSKDSKGQKKRPQDERNSDSKKPPRRPSSITSSIRPSQGSKAEPSPPLKPRPKPKKPTETEISKKPKNKDIDSIKTEPSVKDKEIKDVEIIEKKKPSYRVNIQTAPIWINRNFNEPSCTCFQMTSKAEEKLRMMNNNLVRRWCRDLDKGYQNLKMWNDWVDSTSRTVTILQREIDQIAGKTWCSERCSNKELMKLKRSIDRDAQMWKKLNLHTQERLRSYKRLYQKRSERSCTSNYLICCSKAKL